MQQFAAPVQVSPFRHARWALILVLVLPFSMGEATSPLFLHDVSMLVVDADVIARVPGQAVVLRAPTVLVQPGVTVRAGDGWSAPDAKGYGEVMGMDGGDGGDIVIEGRLVIVHGRLVAGGGGRGGDALAFGAPAIARAGDGGDGGRIVGYAGPHATDGDAGDGGNATAQGADGTCESLRGKDAEARGESHVGPAADGQTANATAGRGGDACEPGVDGGEGGWAYAYGGDAGSVGRRPGQPGHAFAWAGDGGHGGNGCVADLPGGNGGRGGEAFAWGGNMTPGAYVEGSGAIGGVAVAAGGTGGNGGGGLPGGLGEYGGDGHAWGGNISAVAIGGTGAGGGGASIVNGGQGGGGGGCVSATRAVPLPPALVSLGAVTLILRRRRHRA